MAEAAATGTVEQGGQWPVMPKDTEIAVKCAALAPTVAKAQELLLSLYPDDQFEEVDGKRVLKNGATLVISDEETASRAQDLVTHCTKALNTIDARRKAYGEPARIFTNVLNKEVAIYTGPIATVKEGAGAALLEFEKAKRKKEADAAAAAQKEREAKALEDAAKLEAAGNTQGAARVMEVAASAPRRSAVRPVATVGATTGKRTAIRTTWTGSVSNLKEILQAVIDGKLTDEGITISQAWLNKVAAAHQKEEVLFGVQCKKDEKLA